MPVVDVVKDIEHRTLTITAEFAAPIERVWGLYADPRQLEKVWGPPGMPARFVEHHLVPGGRCTYVMTALGGQEYAGWWQISEVDEPNGFTFDEGYADADLSPDPDLPISRNVYSFASIHGGTRAVYVITFDSVGDLQKVIDMGTDEGMRAAIGQIDAYLTTAAG